MEHKTIDKILSDKKESLDKKYYRKCKDNRRESVASTTS